MGGTGFVAVVQLAGVCAANFPEGRPHETCTLEPPLREIELKSCLISQAGGLLA